MIMYHPNASEAIVLHLREKKQNKTVNCDGLLESCSLLYFFFLIMKTSRDVGNAFAATSRVLLVTNLCCWNTLKIYFIQEGSYWRKTMSDIWLCCDRACWLNSKIKPGHLLVATIRPYKYSKHSTSFSWDIAQTIILDRPMAGQTDGKHNGSIT